MSLADAIEFCYIDFLFCFLCFLYEFVRANCENIYFRYVYAYIYILYKKHCDTLYLIDIIDCYCFCPSYYIVSYLPN